MDRNSVVGLILIAVILVVFSIMNAPSQEEQLKAAQIRDSLARVEAAAAKKESITVEKDSSKSTSAAVLAAANDTTIAAATDTAALVVNLDSIRAVEEAKALNDRYGIFAGAAKGEAKKFSIENEKIRVTFNSKGGRISMVEIKNYQTYDNFSKEGELVPLVLFDEDSTTMGFKFNANNLELHSNDFYTSTSSPEKQEVKSGENGTVSFRIPTSDASKYIEIVYTLAGDSYQIGMDLNVVGLEKEEVASSLELNWNSKLLSTERLVENERIISSVFYKYTDEGRSYLSETGNDQLNLEKPISWVAFKQSYFSAVIMSDKGMSNDGSSVSITMINSGKYIKEYNADLNISADDAAKVNIPLRFYFGPNDYDELSKVGNELEGLVNLGWGIFGWVNRFLVIPVFNLLDSFGMNYGLIILLLTIIVKIIILPLTYKNYMSSAKMRVLKPEVDEINKRFGTEDPMKKQQEVMALYRRSGVNPMAGCIPMLIQMPVLIAVFRFFPSAIELRQNGFLWADDLSGYDSIIDFGFNIPLYGDHVSLFTLLMAVSTILITRMNSGQMDTGMPGMKFMMYFFPVMMIFFFNNMSSGLSYYYFVSNILSLVIMWGIKKWFIDEQKILAQIHENRKNPKMQKKSAFMQRLEEAQKMQQQKRKK